MFSNAIAVRLHSPKMISMLTNASFLLPERTQALSSSKADVDSNTSTTELSAL
ncbi:hypothetical protein FBU30_007029, partial [Linnemannia zychae]